MKFAERDSELLALAEKLAKEAYDYFKKQFPLDSMHTVSCFVALYEDLKESGMHALVDLEEFRNLLQEQLRHVITYDTSKWAVEYVCKPSLFIHSKDSEFYLENQKICDAECDFISHTQQADGTWHITWSWADYPEAWSISKNWWKSDLLIKNMQYYKAIRG